MEKTNWKVDGMTCSNCSLTLTKYLEKKGKQNVKVNLISGEVIFEEDSNKQDADSIIKGIQDLGYTVHTGSVNAVKPPRKIFQNHLHRLLFCAVFTLPLMLHMFQQWMPVSWIMNPWVQLALCIPVYLVGMDFFGRSAVRSIRNGMPNMNVLVAIGATASFVYSLTGTLLGLGHTYLFYETTASIITLVFFGNYLEEASIDSTQRALHTLARSQKVVANMIAFNEDHEEVILPVDNDQLKNGDLVLIRSGEQVPADCKILAGQASVNESLITGESLPLQRNPRDTLIGGSIVTEGNVKAQVTAEARHSVLANIIDLVKLAQGEKPPVQLLADRISAIFVPVVLGIAAVTFIINLVVLHAFTPSLMRAVAVLVIACPCAMGLATPAAIAVGLGRAARNGILFRNAKSLELFKDIQQVVFDKTGTLTTGNFAIGKISTGLDEDEFKKIIYSLEKYSNHPIARTITKEWKRKDEIRWSKVDEIKGMGMKASAKTGEVYQAGSFKMAQHLTKDLSHHIYLIRNDELIGWMDLQDEVREEAASVITWLHKKNIKTCLLSGDRYDNCKQVADRLGIDVILAEQSPAEKLGKIAELTAQAPTVMIGDGINDAPALARATIGISLSEASQIAVQTADVVLMNRGIRHLPMALGLGKHTYVTIRQNLFWAFVYNIVAIPVAAVGLLSPALGALVMGLSDVVLAINSGRLFIKKVV